MVERLSRVGAKAKIRLCFIKLVLTGTPRQLISHIIQCTAIRMQTTVDQLVCRSPVSCVSGVNSFSIGFELSPLLGCITWLS